MIFFRILFLVMMLACASATYNLISHKEIVGALVLASVGAFFWGMFRVLGSSRSDLEKHPNETLFSMLYLLYGLAILLLGPFPSYPWLLVGLGTWLPYFFYMIYHYKIKKDFTEDAAYRKIGAVTIIMFVVMSAYIPIKMFGFLTGYPLLSVVVVLLLAGLNAYFYKRPQKAVELLENPRSFLMRILIPIGVLGGGGGMAIGKLLIHTNLYLAWQVAGVFFLMLSVLAVILGHAARLGPLSAIGVRKPKWRLRRKPKRKVN